jgi:hypothetical protein
MSNEDLIERLLSATTLRPDDEKQAWVEDATLPADAIAAIRALEAERDRLREALGDMMALFSADNVLRRGAEVNAALALARAALASKEGGE